MIDNKKARLKYLIEIAWAALIQADPNCNPNALAVKAQILAEALLKIEEAM